MCIGAALLTRVAFSSGVRSRSMMGEEMKPKSKPFTGVAGSEEWAISKSRTNGTDTSEAFRECAVDADIFREWDLECIAFGPVAFAEKVGPGCWLVDAGSCLSIAEERFVAIGALRLVLARFCSVRISFVDPRSIVVGGIVPSSNS